MNDVIEMLESVLTEGREISVCADDPPRIQDWLARREAVFAHFNLVGCQLAEAEKIIVVGLIEAIRRLDAGLIASFQDRLSAMGDELAAARKLKGFLGANGAAQRPALLRRAV